MAGSTKWLWPARGGSAASAVGGREFADGERCVGFLQQRQGGFHDLALALAVVGSAERTAHDVRSDEDPRKLHTLGVVAEGTHEDDHRRDAGGFERPGDMSHGHIADGSDGHQESGIDLVILQSLDQVRGELAADAQLGGGADKREGVFGEPADAPRRDGLVEVDLTGLPPADSLRGPEMDGHLIVGPLWGRRPS